MAPALGSGPDAWASVAPAGPALKKRRTEPLPVEPSAAASAAAAAAVPPLPAELPAAEEGPAPPPEATAAAPPFAAAYGQQGPSAGAAVAAPPLPTALSASKSGLPPELAAALAALPPPAPGDVSAEERAVLLQGALLASALPLQGLCAAGKGLDNKESSYPGFVKDVCLLLSLLRVRPDASLCRRCRIACALDWHTLLHQPHLFLKHS
jgi:hypothetical protein